MDRKYVVPVPGMIITEDVSFLPGVYNFFDKEGIKIAADNITIEGNGAVFIGGKRKLQNKENTNKDEFGYGYSKSGKDDSLGYNGIGFYSNGTSNVTIKNLSAKNFEIGLKLENCSSWNIENNDFSYNYHNPDHGWEEHEDLGGIILYYCDECKIENNRANNVWSALVIRNGNRNIVKDNDFSHTSNVGLRLWRACSNEFYNNNFSWGLRKEPYEVHARDSASVLIETGSNNNRFIKNDMRFGGDGLFIRSLNGWMSTGNYFEENDTSFANNNAIEAWDEGNTYVRNKANFSSYGFWLGNSDNTLLLENEVCYNGVNFKNAPENFGNAGISVVNGSGTNFKMIGNKIHNNNGVGLAIRNRIDYPSLNWVIEENEIYDNKTDDRGFIGHGIYLKYARGINLINNKFHGNDGENVYLDEYVGDVQEFARSGKPVDIDIKIKASSKTFEVGKACKFEAVSSFENLNYRWDFSDGSSFNTGTVNKCFEKPGFHRVILTVNDGENVNYDYINIFVLSEGLEIGTNDEISSWSFTGDESTKLVENKVEYVSGEASLLLESVKGRNITLKYPASNNMNIEASDYTHISFCMRFMNEIIEWYGKNKSPIIRFHKDEDNYVEFTPRPNLFGDIANQYNESKYTWAYIEIGLEKDDNFSKRISGNFDFSEINYLEFHIDTAMDSHIVFMLDGMRFIKKNEETFLNIADVSGNLNDTEVAERVSTSSQGQNSDILAPLTNNIYFGDFTGRWISSNKEGSEFYQIDLGTVRAFNRVEADFYQSVSSTLNSNGEKLPESINIEYFNDGEWHKAGGTISVTDCHNAVTFDTVYGSMIRINMEGRKKPFSVYKIEVNNTINKLSGESICELNTESKRFVNIEKLGVKLNNALNETGSKLSNLVLSLHEYEGDILNSSTLFEKEYEIDEILFKKETQLSVNVKNLDTSKKYYFAVTQKNLAEDMTVGQYYRWSGNGIADMDGTYGYINGSEIVNNNKVGWGSNWMKVYTDRYILDLSHKNDTLGNRFGLNKMEKLYQTFNLKNPACSLVEGTISGLSGLDIDGREVIDIKLREAVYGDKVVVYFKDKASEGVKVKVGEKEYNGEVKGSICEVKVGEMLKEFGIEVLGQVVVKAIEIW